MNLGISINQYQAIEIKASHEIRKTNKKHIEVKANTEKRQPNAIKLYFWYQTRTLENSW